MTRSFKAALACLILPFLLMTAAPAFAQSKAPDGTVAAQQAEIDALKARIAALEARLNTLEAKGGDSVANGPMMSDTEIDSFMDTAEKLFRRFFGLVEELERERNPEGQSL